MSCREMLETERERRELAAALLRGAAAYVRRGWCRGAMARDRLGCSVRPDAPDAVGWSAAGACYRAAMERTGSRNWLRSLEDFQRASYRSAANLALARLRDAVRQESGRPAMATAFWNDAPGRTQAQVAGALDAAADELGREVANLCG